MAAWRVWLGVIGVAALGGLLTAASPVPLSWHMGGFLGPVCLIFAIEGGARRPCALRGLVAGGVFSFVVNAAALYWLVDLLRRFASFPTLAALAAAMLLWLAQALPAALACAFAGAVCQRPGLLASHGLAASGDSGSSAKMVSLPVVLPACLAVATSVSPALFPWRIGHSQLAWLPFVQLAELGGEGLLDVATLAVSSLTYATLRGPRRLPRLGWLALAILLPWGYGTVRLAQVRAARQSAPRLAVGVVQPNVSIADKRDPALRHHHLAQLQRLTRVLRQQGAAIAVWPESAYPFGIARDQEAEHPDRRAILGAPGARSRGAIPVLTGAVTWGKPRPPSAGGRGSGPLRYNSVVAVEPSGRIAGISDKVRLLAFGEYAPLWDWFPGWLQDRVPKGLTPGSRPQVIDLQGVRYGVLNCYEDVLSHYGRAVARDQPDLLVNVTNDAWFGRTSEPLLHQMVARLRAVETRRDLVRAVNTGISSHVAATGETLHATSMFAETGFVAQTALLSGDTPWTRWGDWLTPTLLAWLLAVVLGRRRQNAA